MTPKNTTTSSERGIEHVPLSELKPDPRNPKQHSVSEITDSIGRFGVVDPIVRDDRTGFIISGHGRTKTLRAMKERGETPPSGVLEGEGGEWLVPVAVGWSSRSDSEASAALIAMNRTTELGGWVDDELLALLSDLEELEGGLLGVGYGEDDLDALRNRLQSVAEPTGEVSGDEWDLALGEATEGGLSSRTMTFLLTPEQQELVTGVLDRIERGNPAPAGENRNAFLLVEALRQVP